MCGEAAKNSALVLSSIDFSVLRWMVDTLGEDDALEKFYESMPVFYKFDVVKDFPQCLMETSIRITTVENVCFN